MSTQIKCIIPFAVDTITKDDITKQAGFVDAYIYDQNRPSLEYCLFLMYDDTVDTRESKIRWMKIREQKSLRSVKHIRVNNKPYTVYTLQLFDSFSRYLFKGRVPTGNRATRVLQFWGLDDNDLNNRLLNSSMQIFGVDRSSVPEDDYAPTIEEFDRIYENRVIVSK